jgi:hypothetical protein
MTTPEDPMHQPASFSVAHDIQHRARTDAARDRRHAAIVAEDTKASGKRWFSPLTIGLPLRHGDVDRVRA